MLWPWRPGGLLPATLLGLADRFVSSKQWGTSEGAGPTGSGKTLTLERCLCFGEEVGGGTDPGEM